MGLEVEKLAKFLKNHFYLIIILILIQSPVIYKLTDLLYQKQIDGYKVQVETLSQQKSSLKEENEKIKQKASGYKELLSQEIVTDWTNIKSN
jgi:hypothetical protein